MNKHLIATILALLTVLPGGFAQRLCGAQYLKEALIARNPDWESRIEAQRKSLQGMADKFKYQQKPAAKHTSGSDTIPVIFHIILDTTQLYKIGGLAGIEQRIESQIAVLNEDYNRANADSGLIPYGWMPLYASAGIHFGLAHTRPSGWGTPGYELKIISHDGFVGVSDSYKDAKHATLAGSALSFEAGLDAWDVGKYLNIWCINFTDIDGLLGITVAPSFTTGTTPMPHDETGICINFSAFGRRASSSDFYMATGYADDHYDGGRTLTHETGHFFEIWHTWGDDGSNCPWSGPHKDDGLADTPPEAGAKYYNPTDTVPGGTIYDQCRIDGSVDTQLTTYGVASLDFMNYTDDIAMHMFTTDQAAVMAAQVQSSGESYTLTQHPDLLHWPENAGLSTQGDNGFLLYPNPASGTLHVDFASGKNDLKRITLLDMTGKEIKQIEFLKQSDHYSVDVYGLSAGIYFIRCTFASGNIIRKIWLQ